MVRRNYALNQIMHTLIKIETNYTYDFLLNIRINIILKCMIR